MALWAAAKAAPVARSGLVFFPPIVLPHHGAEVLFKAWD